jgi:hypothetical protein
MIRSEHMKSCLTAQIRFLLFKGPGSFKICFKNLRKFRVIEGLSIDTTHTPPLFSFYTTFKEQKEIFDYQTTTLWFTVKEMQRDKLLQVRLEILLFQNVLLLIGINLPKENIKRREKTFKFRIESRSQHCMLGALNAIKCCMFFLQDYFGPNEKSKASGP